MNRRGDHASDVGAAIGFNTSDPMPDFQRIGTRLARTAQTVISLGRRRCTAQVSLRQLPSKFQFVFERFVKIDNQYAVAYCIQTADPSTDDTTEAVPRRRRLAQQLFRLTRGSALAHIYAEATNNTRHWASRETTSSGTRMINDLSHEACSSRPLLRLSPFFAASV